MTTAICDLVASFERSVVAGGVEYCGRAAQLLELTCRQKHGHLFGRLREDLFSAGGAIRMAASSDGADAPQWVRSAVSCVAAAAS